MRAIRWIGALSLVLMLGAGRASAQVEKTAQPAADTSKQAAMEAMMKTVSPGEAHKALEPFAGNWTYTAQWWTAPDAPPESMMGNSSNSLIFGGRFLKQEIRGESAGQAPFEGLGFTGYDNIRKEYQTIWFDNMATGMMVGSGQFDAESKTLSDQSDFSCPMTGEAHRRMRTVWKIVDQNHSAYESYMYTSDGKEYKAMVINYTRAQ